MGVEKCKRVAVIGAGMAGICGIKCLKEEGIEPVCFERTGFYSGTWRYNEEDIDGLAAITSATTANNSKEMSALSDYPFPKDCPNYPSHKKIYELAKDYANRFDILKHVHFNHEVTHVCQTEDYDETGRWTVTVKNLRSNKITTDVFDGVFVCTGQFAYPNMPIFPGQEKFKGRILHSKQLRTFESFKNEKVVVVGLGCSAVDAATEISNLAEQVYLSTRTGAWVLPRSGPYGLPTDLCCLRRWSNYLLQSLPLTWSSRYIENFFERLSFNHSLYGIKPSHHLMSQDPVVSDILPIKILSGHVIVKDDIKCFTECGVIFEGERNITEVDTVIMATGYQWKFPFLSDGILTKDGDCLNIYKCVYPAQLPHPTLAIIGFILPLGPGFPMGESQCRWAALLINKKVEFPPTEKMLAEVRKTYEMNIKRYKKSDRLTTRVDYIDYLDDIAFQFGAKPNLVKIFFTDQKLFWALWLGPSLPYQYRLQGPHKWSGARNAILTYKERVKYPLRSGRNKKAGSKLGGLSLKVVIAIVVLWFWISLF
ncbi:flavin-containing monooxygenase 5 [Parasteatoda tepidariorum]|uniref:flavin-containing monooxygenase 5 n=1 Tax=Parasteatoda tepidariorum TaxID=114398 RepID=UPI001C723694|nr:flavin-containing monooxygenase 5 [Parasteatoda tepidariorum]